VSRSAPSPAWSFDWLGDKAFRNETLALTRKALREGWPLSEGDRSAIRSGLESLRAAADLRPRQAAAVSEILAEMDAPRPALSA
jgi:hypothetical protein